MSEDSAWFVGAIQKGRAASPTVTDEVAGTLAKLLGGTFREQRVPNKQLDGVAEGLLAAMEPPPPAESAD